VRFFLGESGDLPVEGRPFGLRGGRLRFSSAGVVLPPGFAPPWRGFSVSAERRGGLVLETGPEGIPVGN